jgi:hypothetical protein
MVDLLIHGGALFPALLPAWPASSSPNRLLKIASSGIPFLTLRAALRLYAIGFAGDDASGAGGQISLSVTPKLHNDLD